MSTYALVTLRLVTGEEVRPMNVFGLGGVLAVGAIATRHIVERCIERANAGAPLIRCHEPTRGHCLMLRSGVTDEEQRSVDLRGAVVIDVR